NVLLQASGGTTVRYAVGNGACLTHYLARSRFACPFCKAAYPSLHFLQGKLLRLLFFSRRAVFTKRWELFVSLERMNSQPRK
ncbi:MAG TPA: hypothetical protein VN223_11640, partial [Candidatus Elarobacter sp.]|nr:hypothetical protein [Candidatus Elarobacter sp.]